MAPRKAKPTARWGRKATGLRLQEIAGLPKEQPGYFYCSPGPVSGAGVKSVWSAMTTLEKTNSKEQELRKVLNLTDFGCCQHISRHLSFTGPEAMVLEDILINLHRENGCHFYVCALGNTHHISFGCQDEEVPADGG